MHVYREDASPLQAQAQAHDHDYHAPELRHRENKSLALEEGGGAGGESGAKAKATATATAMAKADATDELVAKGMKEFQEHLEYLSEEPVALSDFLIANISKFRYFAYACGIISSTIYPGLLIPVVLCSYFRSFMVF